MKITFSGGINSFEIDGFFSRRISRPCARERRHVTHGPAQHVTSLPCPFGSCNAGRGVAAHRPRREWLSEWCSWCRRRPCSPALAERPFRGGSASSLVEAVMLLFAHGRPGPFAFCVVAARGRRLVPALGVGPCALRLAPPGKPHRNCRRGSRWLRQSRSARGIRETATSAVASVSPRLRRRARCGSAGSQCAHKADAPPRAGSGRSRCGDFRRARW